MIPKKIHYCWLSGEKIPSNLSICINTWKEIMPDYELILWDSNRFDLKSVAFVEEACKEKKWAFAADYIRAFALYSEGGIYMDSDVLVRKRFDQFLEYDFFTSVHYSLTRKEKKTLDQLIEPGTSKIPVTHKPFFGIQAAIMGSVKGHPFLKDCLDYYSDKHFIRDNEADTSRILAPQIFAMMAEIYGFQYKNELQRLKNNMVIMPAEIFACNMDEVTDNTFAVHYAAGSWKPITARSLIKQFLEKMRLDNAVRSMLGRPQKYKR
jgi:hypothetical protein